MDVLRHCPYCGAPAADAWAEVAHMNAAHPDVIARRLEAAGIREEPPSLAQQLAGAVVLDDDLLADLDKRAARHKTDRAGYLRWVLTGKEPRKPEPKGAVGGKKPAAANVAAVSRATGRSTRPPPGTHNRTDLLS